MKNDTRKNPPGFAYPAANAFTVEQVKRMTGKTIQSVELGTRATIQHVHQSELLVIRFTDGTWLAIDTGSNAANISKKPDDFSADFRFEWSDSSI